MEQVRSLEDNVRGHGRNLRRVALAAGVALAAYLLWAVGMLSGTEAADDVRSIV
ncbi:hypothetical protein [Pseudoxanthomonas suwonensis]|uniref:hypothetical protein n=1 Tax=Pseudoxanthomonas suwonensis TaxID=314722 RepID=UPI0004AC9559|nr:hypothetical protein [Pseudoxanthomonas suwonensis]